MLQTEYFYILYKTWGKSPEESLVKLVYFLLDLAPALDISNLKDEDFISFFCTLTSVLID